VSDLDRRLIDVSAEGSWAAIGPEDEADLILRSAADDPKAIDEVRLRHAERREVWGRKCR
jgi:hypothetical protein